MCVLRSGSARKSRIDRAIVILDVMNRGTAIIWLVVVAACLFIPSGFDTTAEIGTWAAAEHTPATAPVLDTFRASLAQAVRLSSETLGIR